MKTQIRYSLIYFLCLYVNISLPAQMKTPADWHGYEEVFGVKKRAMSLRLSRKADLFQYSSKFHYFCFIYNYFAKLIHIY
jgi:hypothetical protein